MAADLKPTEERDVQERVAIRAQVVHEAIVRQGNKELERPSGALAWSGLAAGLSMSISLIAEAAMRSHIPDVEWRPLVSKLGYPIGFLVVILGRQQLFTENTLTAVLPVLADPRRLGHMLRLWGVVLVANIVGAHLAAWFFGNTSALGLAVQNAMLELGREAVEPDILSILLKGIVAGWLIALVVWLTAADRHNPIVVIGIPTYVLAVAQLSHVVVGSVEVLFLVMTGHHAWIDYLLRFFAPALIGNSIGGVTLVAALNHAQVTSGEDDQ